MTTTVSVGEIGSLIYLIRGGELMLDHDLAGLYQVETKNPNKAVRRTPD